MLVTVHAALPWDCPPLPLVASCTSTHRAKAHARHTKPTCSVPQRTEAKRQAEAKASPAALHTITFVRLTGASYRRATWHACQLCAVLSCRDYLSMICEFVPQMLFLNGLFGYLSFLIVFKWLNPTEYVEGLWPSCRVSARCWLPARIPCQQAL